MANMFSNLFTKSQEKLEPTQSEKDSESFYLDPNYAFTDKEMVDTKMYEGCTPDEIKAWAIGYVKDKQFDKFPADRFPKFCAKLAADYIDPDYINNEFCAQTGYSLSSKDKAVNGIMAALSERYCDNTRSSNVIIGKKMALACLNNQITGTDFVEVLDKAMKNYFKLGEKAQGYRSRDTEYNFCRHADDVREIVDAVTDIVPYDRECMSHLYANYPYMLDQRFFIADADCPVPYNALTRDQEEILRENPDGVSLSNTDVGNIERSDMSQEIKTDVINRYIDAFINDFEYRPNDKQFSISKCAQNKGGVKDNPSDTWRSITPSKDYIKKEKKMEQRLFESGNNVYYYEKSAETIDQRTTALYDEQDLPNTALCLAAKYCPDKLSQVTQQLGIDILTDRYEVNMPGTYNRTMTVGQLYYINQQDPNLARNIADELFKNIAQHCCDHDDCDQNLKDIEQLTTSIDLSNDQISEDGRDFVSSNLLVEKSPDLRLNDYLLDKCQDLKDIVLGEQSHEKTVNSDRLNDSLDAQIAAAKLNLTKEQSSPDIDQSINTKAGQDR